MERKSFVFYASFYNSIKKIKDKSLRCDIYEAIFELALNGNNITIDNELAILALDLIMPQITANNTKYENGKRGGRPSKNKDENEEKNQENSKNSETKKNEVIESENQNFESENQVFENKNQKENRLLNSKPNENVNVNDNVNVNVIYKKEINKEKENELVKFITEKAINITPYEYSVLELYLKDFSVEEIKHALLLGKGKSVSYSLTILKNWFIKKKEPKEKSKKIIPEWFNKSIETESLEESDVENFKKFIEEFRKE